MANDCMSSIHACAIRVARLESDGVPLPGANNLYVSDGIIELSFTPEVEAGDEVTVKNGCGAVCVSHRNDEIIKWWNVELTICRPDPELQELLTGGAVLTDGGAVGYQPPALNTVSAPNGISVEVWSHRLDDGGDYDPTFPYFHWAFPKIKGLHFGARRLFNGALENPFTGGRALENSNWFDGPGNDWNVDSSRAWGQMPTDIIPTSDCGYQTLAAS